MHFISVNATSFFMHLYASTKQQLPTPLWPCAKQPEAELTRNGVSNQGQEFMRPWER
jgi:hypothetical protein